MKSHWLLLLLLPMFLLTVGCGTLAIPKMTSDKVSITLPDGKVLDIDGHKDKTLEGLEYTIDPVTGIATLKIASYSSSANAAAMAEAGATARQNLIMYNLLFRLLGDKGNAVAAPYANSVGLGAITAPVTPENKPVDSP